jgi:hypothetical protein
MTGQLAGLPVPAGFLHVENTPTNLKEHDTIKRKCPCIQLPVHTSHLEIQLHLNVSVVQIKTPRPSASVTSLKQTTQQPRLTLDLNSEFVHPFICAVTQKRSERKHNSKCCGRSHELDKAPVLWDSGFGRGDDGLTSCFCMELFDKSCSADKCKGLWEREAHGLEVLQLDPGPARNTTQLPNCLLTIPSCGMMVQRTQNPCVPQTCVQIPAVFA